MVGADSSERDSNRTFGRGGVTWPDRSVGFHHADLVQYAPNKWENCAMPKRSSIDKRRSKALPALGLAGMSLWMANGACASVSEASANTSPPSQEHEIFLGEEEISDVSLATFHVFDKENAGPPPLFQKPRLARGCGCACSCAPCAYWPQAPQPPKATQPTQ